MPASSSNWSNPFWISIELVDHTVTFTCGWRSCSGSVTAGTSGKAEGMTPSLRLPVSERRAFRMPWRSESSSASMRRAHSSTSWPSGVKPLKRLSRSTSMTPSSSSSWRMAADNAGWVMLQVAAARAKWRSLASATR